MGTEQIDDIHNLDFEPLGLSLEQIDAILGQNKAKKEEMDDLG